jgi:hypothetical protein
MISLACQRPISTAVTSKTVFLMLSGGRRPDAGAMGVRTRGLDIKAGAAKLKADRAARLEAEAVVQRWNDQLSAVARCCGRLQSGPR